MSIGLRNLLKRAGFDFSKTWHPIRYQASDTATILAMVKEGRGISLVPTGLLPARLEGMVALPLDPPQPLQLGLAVKSKETASPGANLFIATALAWAHGQAARAPSLCTPL